MEGVSYAEFQQKSYLRTSDSTIGITARTHCSSVLRRASYLQSALICSLANKYNNGLPYLIVHSLLRFRKYDTRFVILLFGGGVGRTEKRAGTTTKVQGFGRGIKNIYKIYTYKKENMYVFK